MKPVERLFTHPGEMLREEFMLPLSISANALAHAIGVPSSRILDILHEHRGVTADTAARLARYFGTTERFWLNLQAEYDLSIVRQKKSALLECIIPHTVAQSVLTTQSN